jgi:tetraacyldisaccharide 4'-kinase
MDEQRMIEILSGSRRGVGPSALRLALRAAACPYAGAMRLRRLGYRWGVLPSQKVQAPVISIGNVTAGGTGKTPMVAWTVDRLTEMGYKAGIVTRGYRSRDGVSDEAALLAESCPDSPIIVNPDRAAGAGEAIAHGAQVIVLDDGFQHRRLRRELDLVLIDATRPLGFGHVLPRGLLREPASALRDADAIIITRSDKVTPEQLDDLQSRLARLAPQAPRCLAVHRPTRAIDDSGSYRDLAELAGRKVAAFCGIGNPDAFFDTLAGLHVRVACRRVFADHAPYDQDIADSLSRDGCHCDAELLVTTTKDHVKLAGLALDRPVWQLAVEMDVTDGREQLLKLLQRAAAKT